MNRKELTYMETSKRCSEDEPYPDFVAVHVVEEVVVLPISPTPTTAKSIRIKEKTPAAAPAPRPNPLCCCYRKPIKDARCCGACYTFCYKPKTDKDISCCPVTCVEYCNICIMLRCGHGSQDEDMCWSCVCLPLRFSMSFLWCFGAVCNESINYCRKTDDDNYLC